jgi:hypothetical protein
MRNKKNLGKITKTHILKINDFFSENPAIYEMLWKNIIDPNRPQNKI